LQLLQERGNADFGLRVLTSDGGEYANASHPLGLLRTRYDRPCKRGTTEHDEKIASCHGLPEAHGNASYNSQWYPGKAGRKPMSALGQKQTCALQKAVSALHPKADIRAAQINVC
jgi:hypothetical protein